MGLAAVRGRCQSSPKRNREPPRKGSLMRPLPLSGVFRSSVRDNSLE
jgi:hypothetical protein